MNETKKTHDYRRLFREMWDEWRWLLRYIKKYWWGIGLYILIGLVGTVMGLGTSVASKYLIDAVVSHNDETIIGIAAMVIGLAVMQIVLNAGTSWISARVGSRVHKEIRSDFFSRVIRADWEDVNTYHSGDLINRLEGDVTTVSGSVVSFLPGLVTKSVQFLGALGIVLYYDVTMAILALIGSPIVVLTSRYMVRRIRDFSKESREMNSRILSFGEESMQNLQTIKAFDLPRSYAKRFGELLECYRNVKLSYDKFSILMTMCLSFVGLLVSYSCYGWGVWRLWQGAITYGTMTMFLQLAGVLTASFSALVGLAPSAVSIATSAGRIMELRELLPEADSVGSEAFCEKARAEGVTVRADGLCFTYKDGVEPVIAGADFYAAPGETVAIIGPSGEGKTTALRLLLGLLHPRGGSLYLELSDGQTLPIGSGSRSLCAYVPQGGSLFTGTIAENLRLVNPEATEAEMIEALRQADAWGFVSALPDGLETAIGEKGVNFSEGQGQRMAIARAILRGAPLLLLDEATSALDIDTERRVLQALMREDPRRTCILTTHRYSVLRYCKRVYQVGEDGKMRRVDPEAILNA